MKTEKLLQIAVTLFRDNVKKMNRKGTVWEKVFAKLISDKGLKSRICKDLL